MIILLNNFSYKVYDTTIDTHNDLEFLRLHQMNDKLDFWVLLKSIPSIARVMVPPDDQSSFEDSLRNQSIVFHISVHDAEKLVIALKL